MNFFLKLTEETDAHPMPSVKMKQNQPHLTQKELVIYSKTFLNTFLPIACTFTNKIKNI